MARFDVHKWRTKQYQKDLQSDQLLEYFIHEYLSQSTTLDEGKLGDFFNKIKDKIKKTETFQKFIALAGETKDASKAVSSLFRMKAWDILPQNEKQAQILKDVFENENPINELEYTDSSGKTASKSNKGYTAEDELFKQKAEKAREEDPEFKKAFKDTFMGKAITVLLGLVMVFNMFSADFATLLDKVYPDAGIEQMVDPKVVPTHSNYGSLDTALDNAGFDDPNQRADIIMGLDDETSISNAYSHGGDIKINVSDDGQNVDIEPDPQDGDDLDPDNILDTDDYLNLAQEQGLKIELQDNQTANFTIFDFGSSEITEYIDYKIQGENDVIIQKLLNGQNYSETIVGQASNTDSNTEDDINNSNFDDSTGEDDKLMQNRAQAVYDTILDDLKAALDDEGISYDDNGSGTITLENGAIYKIDIQEGQDPSSLKYTEPGSDNSALQSAIRIGEEGDTPPTPKLVVLDFDPVAIIPDEPEVPEPEETDAEEDEVIVPPVKVKPEEFTELTTGIRETQFAMIFQLIAPDVPIFYYLNKMLGYGDENKFMGVGKYGQRDFLNLRNSEDPEIPQEAKKLAGILINLRKSPDGFIKKISNILNIELEARHPARHYVQGAQKGYGRHVAGQSMQETHPFNDLLINEAAVDEFIDERFVKNYAAEILMMLGSMYTSNQGGNIAMSILNPEKLPDDVKRMVTTLGFKPITTGMEAGQYVFLGDGEYSLQVGDGDEPSTTPTQDQQPQDQAAFNAGKVFTSPDEKDHDFPKGIENTKFYKDAVKDGWTFRPRIGLPPKTTYKIIPFTDIDRLNNLNYKELKAAGKLDPTASKLKEKMKIKELQKLIRNLIKEAEEENIHKGEETGVKPLPDVNRMHAIMARFIDNRREYEQLLKDVLEFDVPQKKAAINQAFKDKPSLRSQIVSYYGDENDKFTTLLFKDSETIDQQTDTDSVEFETGETEEEPQN